MSVDSHFTHLAWVNTPRNKGGLGGCAYPLVADLTKQVRLVWVRQRAAKDGAAAASGLPAQGCFGHTLTPPPPAQIAKDYGVLIEEGDDAGVSLR